MSPSPCFASLFVKRDADPIAAYHGNYGNDHHYIGAQSIHFACFLFSWKTSTRETLMETLTTLHGVPTYFSDFLTYLANENGVLTFKFWKCFLFLPLFPFVILLSQLQMTLRTPRWQSFWIRGGVGHKENALVLFRLHYFYQSAGNLREIESSWLLMLGFPGGSGG